ARSTDGGDTWSVLASDTFAGQLMRSVVPTTLGNGSVVLVGTEFVTRGFGFSQTPGGGVYRSTDSGASFVHISGAAGTGLPNQDVSDLVADPGNPGRFYAAVPIPSGAPAPTGNEGIYRSDHGGLTWTSASAGLPGLNTAKRILLAVHNSRGYDVLYAAIISPAGDLQGVFRSADLGI